ncbi:hypothetical protein [Rhodococcus opacus]|nr:hypothetical protein [Rhodococcus opacus]
MRGVDRVRIGTEFLCIVDTAASSAFVRASGIVVAVAHPAADGHP